MRAAMRNGRPSAEAFGTPAVTSAGPSHAGDISNLHLHLIRVQPASAAARGRGLVRFLTDLSRERPIPVVAHCAHCGKFWNVEVDLSDATNPVVLRLRDNCTCGASLDTPHMIRDLVGTARNLAEAVWIGGTPA